MSEQQHEQRGTTLLLTCTVTRTQKPGHEPIWQPALLHAADAVFDIFIRQAFFFSEILQRGSKERIAASARRRSPSVG